LPIKICPVVKTIVAIMFITMRSQGRTGKFAHKVWYKIPEVLNCCTHEKELCKITAYFRRFKIGKLDMIYGSTLYVAVSCS